MNNKTTERLVPLSPQQIAARVQQGVANPGLVEDPIQELFEAAENGGHELPPVEERSWVTSRTEIQYSHPLFGKVTVGVKNCSLDEPQVKGSNTWARIYCPNSRVPQLEIQAVVKTIVDGDNGIKVLCVATDYDAEDDSQKVTEIKGGTVPPFVVAVDWGQGAPHTRQYHRDNFDIILLNPENGKFIQVEVEIVTRNGYFWLCIQEVFCGQWVRTTLPIAMGLRVSAIDYGDRYPLLAVPLYAQYAYPGVDYVNGVCEDIPSKVAPFVKEWKAFVPYHKSVKATWDPVGADLPETMKGKGWHLGLPEFFCGVTGYGRILCQDGEKCFVHFSRIIGPDGAPVGSRGKLPILEPMKYVAIKYQNGDKGRQATAVRIL